MATLLDRPIIAGKGYISEATKCSGMEPILKTGTAGIAGNVRYDLQQLEANVDAQSL